MRITGRTSGNVDALSVNRKWKIHHPVHWRRGPKWNFARCEVRHTHIGFVFTADAAKFVDAGNSFESNLILGPTARFDQVCRNAAQAVARTFGFTTITIDDPQLERIAGSRPQNQAIGTNPEIAVTDSLSETGIIGRNVRRLLDENEVVSERLRLNERYHSERPRVM